MQDLCLNNYTIIYIHSNIKIILQNCIHTNRKIFILLFVNVFLRLL